MKVSRLSSPRGVAAAAGILVLVGAAAAVPSAVGAQTTPKPLMAVHRVLVAGLDNPRQLHRLNDGDFLIAQAGHGGHNPANCSGTGEDAQCIGISSKISRLRYGHLNDVMTGLISAAGTDGTFAIGADGADIFPGGPYYAIETYAPPEEVPPGLPGGQLGWLFSKVRGGPLTKVANISAYEQAHDPDGEGFDSDPYSVLALDNQILVADAAGDDILSVRNGQVSLWAELDTDPNVDPVPTTLTKAPNGTILVGELHSEIPHAAHVWLYNRSGDRVRGWPGFTTITGVARGGDGSLYVSELFGGPCGFDQIPTCFPGRVVKVAPDGTRTHVPVPFPAGIAVHRGHVYVNAFSVSPKNGFGGNPDWSGQLWEINI